MENYRTLTAQKQWMEARDVLVYGVECGHLPAKLELARLYKDCTLLNIPQQERYAKSEYYYRNILNLLDLPDRAAANISVELAELLAFMKRPIGVLAMLLRAKRLGAHVPDHDVDHAKKLLVGLDVNSFGKSPLDAYELGLELNSVGGSEQLTELLLREASESTNKLIRGKALLALAEFYNERRSENHVYAGEAARCYRMAAETGFPEYLSRSSKV